MFTDENKVVLREEVLTEVKNGGAGHINYYLLAKYQPEIMLEVINFCKSKKLAQIMLVNALEAAYTSLEERGLPQINLTLQYITKLSQAFKF